MYRRLRTLLETWLAKKVPATGLGLFRIGFGLVAFQEILFLFHFRHLIFDPLPFIDRASPVLHLFLLLWMAAAGCLALGYRTRWAALANYAFWVIFVVFTPMWQDFDGGFDQLMTGSSFLLMFLPSERALSLDNLRLKLRHSTPTRPYQPPGEVSVLAYTLPLAFSLGLLYFDSGLHKLSAEFWRNGMGAWLPPTMPYYMSALDMSPLLNLKWVEMFIGYTILVFQFLFLPLMWFRPFRVPLLVTGVTFHTGIVLSLNIYPFGFAMLVHYFLMVPFAWWRRLHTRLQHQQPVLTVFYDQDCPLCNRTVIIVRHFDPRGAIAFQGLQSQARHHPELDAIPQATLLRDLHGLDRGGRLYAGLDTYIRILIALGYAAPLGWLLRLPGVYHWANRVYRRIADNRQRLSCDAACPVPVAPAMEDAQPFARWYARYAASDRQIAQRIAKFVVLVLVLQLNSTVHYGLLYRWAGTRPVNPTLVVLDRLSDTLINYSHAFLGITPHALYLHDHFAGYHHIFALAYRDPEGRERWLPFVNREGRLLAPYWGRVQSMWANVAVTAHPSRARLEKFLGKITAYFAVRMGVDLTHADFAIKMKKIRTPMHWEKDLRRDNLAQPWRDVGTVAWRQGRVSVLLPETDLEML
ncbi:DCC1-like thiol-disulfide oxidoreductase family protein [Candidatus Methylocalor cossyra]|uniref:Predicted thiol-disulfide oxidoreductase YuxK, DCC family n=1 Tax=Candidatus Methylocalor cossyra TaxID=3108543 RepID=A0ABM9NHR8_9GAMM